MSRAEVRALRVVAADEGALAAVVAGADGARATVEVSEEKNHGSSAGDPTVAVRATLEVRGGSSRGTAQKSFRLTLDEAAVATEATAAAVRPRQLALNKHPFDLTRVRNRLAFDSFAEVPYLDRASPRADFVRLFANGADLGLFTRLEEPDASFLAARGLDPAGTLYRARTFFWQPLDAATAANPAAMAAIVEPCHHPDPARLARTCAALADPAEDVNATVARHFQRDNYLSWLAVNVLTGNYDTIAQNFFIYGPPPEGEPRDGEGRGWLFIPWDYDGAFEYYQQAGEPPPPPGVRPGPANWWSVPLFQRFASDPANLRDLDRRLDELAAGPLAGAAVRARLDDYRATVRPVVLAAPDVEHLPTGDAVTPEEKAACWDAEYARLDGVVSRRLAEHRAASARPMPVWLYEPVTVADGGGGSAGGSDRANAGTPTLVFSWSPSRLVGAGTNTSAGATASATATLADPAALTYDLELASASTFAPAEVLASLRGLREPQATATVPPGARFWRVVIRSDDRPDVNWQTPFGSGFAPLPDPSAAAAPPGAAPP